MVTLGEERSEAKSEAGCEKREISALEAALLVCVGSSYAS